MLLVMMDINASSDEAVVILKKSVADALSNVVGCERLTLIIRPFDRGEASDIGSHDITIVLTNVD
eukprot:10748531-Heterocapsa_arctica.AAC.1